MNEYQPSAWHYLTISLPIFVLGTAAMYWYMPLLWVLYALGGLSAAFIFVMGVWGASTANKYGTAAVMDSVKGLSKEQQNVIVGRYPELKAMFGNASIEAVIMFEDSEVDYRFFVEFMERSNAFQTWAKRDIEATRIETRDVRREKFNKLTAWLMHRRHLAAAPNGNETYQWRSGAYLQLWNSYVLPYADIVGMRAAPIVVAPERTAIYQSEVENGI